MDFSKKGLTSNERFDSAIISRAEPSRAEPSRAEPSRAEPSRAEPSRAEPLSPPRARECCCPPPPDRLPPRRGGRSSLQSASAAGRPASFARLAGARRALLRSARAVAVVACLCLAGPLALPAQAQTTNFYLWSTTMTVGESNDYFGYDKADSYGSMSTSREFNYPPWSPPGKHHFDPDYELAVRGLFIDPTGGSDRLTLRIMDTDTRNNVPVGNVTLWIRNTSFPVVGFNGSGLTFGFDVPDGPDLDWEEGEKVRVVLSYERLLPSEPRNVSVTAPRGEGGTLEVSWDAADEGTFPIECYLVEFRHPSGEAKKRKQSYPGSRGTGKGCGDTPPTSVTRTDLEPDVRYQVLVQALSGDGYGEWSDMKTARTNQGRALQGRFLSPPERHDGTKRIKVRVAFSEAPENVGADGVEVEGGRVTSVSPLGGNAPGGAGNRSAGGRNAGREDREVVWEFEIEPDSDGDVTVSIEAGRACDEPGAICTADGRSLSEDISTTVEGPPPLTASFEDVPAAHDGESAFTLRMASSEPIGISYRSLREDAFTVSGGRVTRGTRVDDRRDLFEMTVRPESDDDVTITLPAGRECAVSGAICTKGKNRRKLTNTITATVAGPPDDAPAPLTASFEDLPVEHEGEGGFTLRMAFSEPLSWMNGQRLREDVVAVSGGRATKAGRVNRRRDLWELTVEPDSPADVTVTLAAGAVCGTPAAVCTKDGRALSNTVSATVRGPVGIAVADARVEEGAGAVLAFVVTLSRAASGTLTVDYATSDGTATAGTDYTAASGTLTFTAGDRSKTISVAVLDDSHDEGEETLTLRLSDPSGGRVTDGEATGTIENRDPLPKAFMARFGRTAAVHVVEQVQERIEAPREVGIEAQFAGRQLRPGMEREMAVEFLSRLAPSVGANRVGAGVHHPRSVSPAAAPGTLGTPRLGGGAPMGTADELLGGANPMGSMPGTDDGLNQRGDFGRGLGGGNLLTGSAFVMNHETRRGGILSFWSRGAQSRFAGRDGQLSLGGRVRTTMFGADYAKGPLVAGLSLSHSRGLGEYTGVDVGEVTSSVTGLYPWLGYKVTDRITLWGVTGYGKGALSLTPGAGTALRSGLSMAMTAGGMRGELADSVVGGFGLAFKADALWVGTGIEGVDGPQGRLAATSAAVTRYRTALEASRGYSFKRGLSLQPSLEVGVRRDGGDAENGAGVDVGGGLIVADEVTGLSADVRVRMLLVHQDQGFRDRGVSISFSYNPTPSTPLGFVAKLTPSWGGQATSGARALWGRETMAGMAHGGMASGNRLEAELGYGLPVGSRLVGTPRFGIGTSEHGRDYRLGYGLTVFERGSMNFELGIEGTRRESSMQGVTDHGALARLTARW